MSSIPGLTFRRNTFDLEVDNKIVLAPNLPIIQENRFILRDRAMTNLQLILKRNLLGRIVNFFGNVYTEFQIPAYLEGPDSRHSGNPTDREHF
jgi:hypothetical protein